MKKIYKLSIYIIFVFTLCLCFMKNTYAATEPGLVISRFDYTQGDLVLTEDESYFKSSIGTQMQLYALIEHGNDMTNAGIPTGWYVDKDRLENVTWTSSNTSVATIDSNGTIAPKAAGTTTITAKYTDTTRNKEFTGTKTITVFNKTCDHTFIENWKFKLYYSTGTFDGPDAEELTGSGAMGNDAFTNHTLPTPRRDGYTFGGWYASKEFKEEDKVEGGRDADYSFSYDDDTCKLYKAYGTLYAKWIPNDTPSPSPSTPTTPQPTRPVAERVNVEDTGISSGLYIICISLLLTTFGVLIIVKSVKDKKVQQQQQ